MYLSAVLDLNNRSINTLVFKIFKEQLNFITKKIKKINSLSPLEYRVQTTQILYYLNYLFDMAQFKIFYFI